MLTRSPMESGHTAMDQRADLVEELKRAGFIRSELVERAFRSVPRHAFLPGTPLGQAYADKAVVTKWEGRRPVSSASQPRLVAWMLEQLDIKPGMRILEIGSGTGYNAALLAHIAGPENVTTVEIDGDLAAMARDKLRSLGYGSVVVLAQDAADTSYAEASYDRIIVTVGAWDILPSWFEALAPGGKIVIPLSLNGIQCTACLQKVAGQLESRSIGTGGFMAMEGRNAGPRVYATADDGSVVLHEWPDSLPDRLLFKLLREAAGRVEVARLKEGLADGAVPFLYFFALNGYRIVHVLRDTPSLACIDPACESAFLFPGNSIAEGWMLCDPASTAIRDFLLQYEVWLSLGRPAITDAQIEATLLRDVRTEQEAFVRRVNSTTFEVKKTYFRYTVSCQE